MKYRILRLFLFVTAFGWIIAIAGAVLPWSMAIAGLICLGAGDIAHDPMVDYWRRMASGAFTGIGVFVFIVALRPSKFENIIGLIGVLSVFEGLILLIHGLRLRLPPFPFYGDVFFCLFIGAGIWILRKDTSNTPSDRMR